MSDHKSSLNKVLIDFALLIYSLFKVIPNLLRLLEIEARAVGENAGKLLLLYLIAGTVLPTFWICLMAICLLGLISLNLSWISSLFILLLINLALLIILALVAKKAMRKMVFSRSRQLIRNIKN
jgi:hypothetical protein